MEVVVIGMDRYTMLAVSTLLEILEKDEIRYNTLLRRTPEFQPFLRF